MADTLNSHLVAVVDMGSNGIRFSITDMSPPSARTMPILFQDRAGISLFDAQFSRTDGTRIPIPEDVIQRVISRLIYFKTTCEDFGVPNENVHVLATEATRMAPNSEEFRSRIYDATGWTVRLLSKEVEGRIGALGVASSSSSIAGLAMDLGGGSTQITWVVERDGNVTISPKGSFSFPYGAAALSRRLERARQTGASAEAELKREMMTNFQQAYEELEICPALLDAAESRGGFDLYLCGGGFRGWGYMLMSRSKIQPYPIPIINGYRATREEFEDTASVLAAASASGANVFGVSKRRASQIPAVAFLVSVIAQALPVIKNIQFCQGGVREGFLYEKLPSEIRQEDPLVGATQPYAPVSRDAIRTLLQSALPDSSSYIEGTRPPISLSSSIITALANLLYAHSNVPRESRAAAALHSTTTGILASTNSLSHVDRAILALILSERCSGELGPADEMMRDRLELLLSAQEVWWCRYLGRIAALVGDVYPSAKVTEQDWRIKIAVRWNTVLTKKATNDMLCVNVILNQQRPAASVLRDALQDMAEWIEKLGKKKSRVQLLMESGLALHHGVKIEVSITGSDVG